MIDIRVTNECHESATQGHANGIGMAYEWHKSDIRIASE